MALIRDRKPAAENWRLLDGGANGAPPDTGDVIVPLAAWRRGREALLARNGRIGVWLAASDDPAELAGDLAHFGVIAVRFAQITDGRGYSIARLLRERYGWRGELRAIGDVQRDQIHYLARCGFDAFELREGENVEAALAAFDDFSEAYQAAVDPPEPLFRRRALIGARS